MSDCVEVWELSSNDIMNCISRALVNSTGVMWVVYILQAGN